MLELCQGNSSRTGPDSGVGRTGSGSILISATALSVELAGRQVLSNIRITVKRGEIVTIVGPNGAGKSTLLRALVGAVPPSAGKIERVPGLRVGYVPQRLHLDGTLPITVERFLRLGAFRRNPDIGTALEETGVPHLASRQMTALSGGQFQRVLMARALLASPDLLLLDEPAQGLDQPGVSAFYRLVDTLRRRLGCAVLMASHDLHVVMGATDRVICLKGVICCEGKPEAVAANDAYVEMFGSVRYGELALYRDEADHVLS